MREEMSIDINLSGILQNKRLITLILLFIVAAFLFNPQGPLFSITSPGFLTGFQGLERHVRERGFVSKSEFIRFLALPHVAEGRRKSVIVDSSLIVLAFWSPQKKMRRGMYV